MRAFTIPSAGSDVVELSDVPVPTVADDELLVEVKAVGVGIHDSYFLPTDARYPYPIGIEAAGVVAEIGAAVTGYQQGDRISFVTCQRAGRCLLRGPLARSAPWRFSCLVDSGGGLPHPLLSAIMTT